MQVRLRFDKASVKTICTKEQSEAWLDFMTHAHDDLGNLLVLVGELRSQRNDALIMNPSLTAEGVSMAMQSLDTQLQALIKIRDDEKL